MIDAEIEIDPVYAAPPPPLTITVAGTPAPQGSKRHVGKGVLIESSKKVKPWREAVKFAALEAMKGGWAPLEGPVAVRVAFGFLKPKSAPKKRETSPITRSSGDIDKLLRATLDALVDAGVMRDDSQVINVSASKDYAGTAGACIEVAGV